MSIFLVLAHSIVPIVLAVWVARSSSKNLLAWIGKSTALLICVLDLFFTGFWPFYCFGYIGLAFIFLLSAVAVVQSFRRIGKPNVREQQDTLTSNRFGRVLGFGFLLLLSGASAYELVSAVRATIFSGDWVNLAFPLKGGRYYVVHGGNHPCVNNHYPADAQRAALDVVQLNALGMRSKRLLPEQLFDYKIFGEPVYSPAEGVVVKAVDGVDDFVSPNENSAHPAGNHIVVRIRDSNTLIVLAHLLNGSLLVKEGDLVATGQALGRVGNSGNSTEPHLHIHCVKENASGDYVHHGEAVSMLFDGSYLIRNSIFSSN